MARGGSGGKLDVSVVRGGRLIWSEGTFAIPAGGIVAVIGSNGSGKSTLLQVVLGLLPVASGSVQVLGGRPGANNDAIGYVPQDYVAGAGEAIRARDFDAFARITMQDSNQFHAVALDTDPPIFYMNDVSRAIIALVTEYNRVAVAQGGKLKAAYTYDAGPNAVIYAPKENIKEIVELIVRYFPQAEPFKDSFGLFGVAGVGEGKVVDGFNAAVAKKHAVGAVKGLIHTRVGDGPRKLGQEEALLGTEGLPKFVA